MRLIQYVDRDGTRHVAAIEGNSHAPRTIRTVSSTRELALDAARRAERIEDAVKRLGLGEVIDYDLILKEKRILPPLDHEDSHRCVIAVTGLTHLGSAATRDAMHAKLQADNLSDSMKMFKLGVDGGKPQANEIGVQPEWAYKGDGSWIVAPEQEIDFWPFAEDCGDEAEVVGLYVIGDNGEVLRVGYALGNEYSDHVMERHNYLYLAHSKLRQCAFGPELLVGELPAHVIGKSTILRNGNVLWSSEFLSGEDNMVHSIANLEHHHFKYDGFRQPGDVHIYFYGAAAFSFADAVKPQVGDVFEVACAEFGRPLRNAIAVTTPENTTDNAAQVVRVMAL